MQLRAATPPERPCQSSLVTAVVHQACHPFATRFYERADEIPGMAPGRFRNGGCGEKLEFASAPCSLGWLLAASTKAGLCSVMLGDGAAPLEAELRRIFPKAAIQPGGHAFKAALSTLLDAIAGHPTALNLPLDLQATAFQAQVWRALRQIPRGATLSYAGLASGLGKPRAVRAVARACAANPVALLVPCHRVIGAHSELRGYRWGLERKKKLLEMESAPPGLRL